MEPVRMIPRGRYAFGKRHSMLLAAIVLASLGSLSETSVAFVQSTSCSGVLRAVPRGMRSCTLRKSSLAGRVPVVACSSSRTGTSAGAGGMAELLKVQREALPDRCPECYEQVVVSSSGARPKFCRCGMRFEDAEVRHWTDKEARKLQFKNKHLGVSSCGVCSVLSSLTMLGKIKRGTPETDELMTRMVPLVKKRACDTHGSRCRHNTITLNSTCSVGLRDHLVSRSECGSSGSGPLISTVQSVLPEVAGAAVQIGEECPIPEGQVLEWMAGWMRDGAALTITYNRQRRVGEGADVPDCWHAQAVYTVDLERRTVGLTNPKREMHEEDLLNSLPSPAMLLVRANEVLMHAVNMTDEQVQEVEWPNSRWSDMGVTRQVLELRERYRGDSWPDARDEFVSVPYAGTGEGVGPCIRIFAVEGSRAAERIKVANHGDVAKGTAVDYMASLSKNGDSSLRQP